MFGDLAKVTIANVIVLFLGFLRDLVLSYNFGISKFTDSFFSIYLLVEDFNVIINTGLVFGLINYFGTLNNLGINIKNFIFSKIKVISLIPFILISINLLILNLDLFPGDKFLISFFGTSGLPLSLIAGFFSAYLMFKSNIFIAIISKTINYLIVIISLFFLNESSNPILFGLIIFCAYLFQLIFLFYFLNKEADNSIIKNKIESNSFTNDAISWSIAPFFMPFLGNIFIRIILLSKGDQLISIINYANKILVLVNAFTFSIILVGYQKAVTAKNESIDLFKDDINLNIRRIVYLLVPISILISFNSEFIIKVIFERGKFTPETTLSTAYALSVLSLSIFPGTLFGYLIRVYAAFFDRRFYYMSFILWMVLMIIITVALINHFPIISYPIAYLISLAIVAFTTLNQLNNKINISIIFKDIIVGISLGLLFIILGAFFNKFLISIFILLFLLIFIFKNFID